MITDNFELIKNILRFDSKDDFYFLQIIQRKKDGCNVSDSCNNGYRVIKSYYIRSITDLDRRRDKIIELCRSNNARAYINLNRRNTKQVALAAAKSYIDLVREDRCNQGYRIWDHCCGITRDNNSIKYWIVDIDSKDKDKLQEVISKINLCKSKEPLRLPLIYEEFYCGMGGETRDNVKYIIPTPNGYHLLTIKFDARPLNKMYNIKKDNPTILYYDDLA